MITQLGAGTTSRPVRARGRFVRERDAAIASLVEGRPMGGERLEVEVRPDITILWQRRRAAGGSAGGQHAGARAAATRSRVRPSRRPPAAEGLVLHTMGEQRLWKLLGVPG